MEFVLIGIVSALNLIIILIKFKKGRIQNGVFDTALFVLLAFMFSGSYGGMVVAMISSLIISLYLFVSPPEFFKASSSNQVMDELREFVKKP